MRVIIFHADGLPVWALGAFGNEWIATPHVDEFAANAVIFDNHFADVPRPLSPSNLAGRFPFSDGNATADHGGPSLSDDLKRSQIPLIHCDVDDCGEHFDQVRSLERCCLWIDLPVLQPPDPGNDVDEGDEQPHSGSVPGIINPEDDATIEHLQTAFGSVVEQVDSMFGECLSRMRDERVWDNAIVFFTSGRGQNLGEHGVVGNVRPWLHEELVHLPLMIHFPEMNSGRRIPHLTQTVDLLPTITARFGTHLRSDSHGFDLHSLGLGSGPVRDYIVIESEGEFALQTTDVKIIVPNKDPSRGPMYFVKPDDRWEVNNLWTPNVDRAEVLQETMRDFVASARRAGKLNPPSLPRPETNHGNRETGG